MLLADAHTSSLMTSESESYSDDDDEIIFDDDLKRRSKLPAAAKAKANGSTPKKNGFAKFNRDSNA
jgi:hypothetical protein